ncbi:DUF4433 domain-containing protein [Breznakia sp. OttesenSCG-928-G09]|nr:DUF4433 domain-containing protein [Breznakia sp. OttesenSCG-928-G09]
MNQILEDRGIKYLVHFTQAENLYSIFRYGLLPRTDLMEKNIESYFNFKSRKYHDAIALSIEFPDYVQFNSIRFRQHNLPWVILLIDASILASKKCAFSPMKGSPLSYGENAFLQLFDEVDDQVSRKELKLDSKYPTTVQSKVLCYDEIPVEYIKEVHFEDRSNYFIYKGTIPTSCKTTVKICQTYFQNRNDYEYWKINNYKRLPE